MPVPARKFTMILETFVVALLLGAGSWNTLFYFCRASNTNNLHLSGSLEIRVFPNNDIRVTGRITNDLQIPLKNISVIVDAYDANERILGTGKVTFGPGMIIKQGNSNKFDVTVMVPAGYHAVKKFMVIPHSGEGTGKLANVIVSSL